MPFPRWMERIALSRTTLPGESYTALGDSSIDYFYPSMEVPCKHTYISGLQCTCAPLTHMQTQWIQWSMPQAYSLFYNQMPTSTSSWASSNHEEDESDGELNRDEWRDEGINKWKMCITALCVGHRCAIDLKWWVFFARQRRRPSCTVRLILEFLSSSVRHYRFLLHTCNLTRMFDVSFLSRKFMGSQLQKLLRKMTVSEK